MGIRFCGCIDSMVKRLNSKFNTLFVPLAIFLSCFVLAFVAGSFVIQSQETKAVTGLELISSPAMTLVSSSSVDLSVTPTTAGAVALGSHSIMASTNVPTGYSLSLATIGAPAIAPTMGTIAAPTDLESNTWGYSLTSTGTNIWVGLTAAPAVIKNTTSLAANDQTTVYYGAKIDMTMRSGTYAHTVRYTATANLATIPAPTIISVSPNSGTTLGGTAVQIIGTGFTVNDRSVATGVTLDGTACTGVSISSNTPTTGQDTIYCNTPAHAAGAVSVAVTTWSGTATKANSFTYVLPIPVVTAISPNNGHFRGGETFTITGSNFTGASAVRLGNSACRSFTVVSSTSITCVSSGIAASFQSGANSTMTASTNVVTVNVTNQYGTNPTNALFTYRYLNKSTTAAGSYMDIRGTDLVLGSKVFVNGVLCSNLKITGNNTAACTTSIAAAGNRNVTVQTSPASQGNMQNWTGCSAIATPAYNTTSWASYTRVLTDTRNGQKYRVRKMPDGKCWMIDNIKLANFTLTSANSNVTSNFTIPANPVQGYATHSNGICVGGTAATYGDGLTCDGIGYETEESDANYSYIAYTDPALSDNPSYYACINQIGVSPDSLSGCGYLYNWYTATAGTGKFSVTYGTYNVASSICPAGWKLPTISQFRILDNALTTGSTTDLDESTSAAGWKWWYNGVFEAASAGEYLVGGFHELLSGTGRSGEYWTSTHYDERYTPQIGVDSDYVRFGIFGVDKSIGQAVRCMY